MPDPTAPSPRTVGEGARVLAAEQAGDFVLLRDEQGELLVVPLRVEDSPITIGRRGRLAIPWDDTVSRIHAELVAVGDRWTLVDDGLSRNGVHVNGVRLTSRRRLEDGDAVRVGATTLVVRLPGDAEDATRLDASIGGESAVTDAQRRVLQALCRPMLVDPVHGLPAGNDEIAAELSLSVDAVKGHLRLLYARMRLEHLPPHAKRQRLAQRAISRGLVRQQG